MIDQCQTCHYLHGVKDPKEIGKTTYVCRRHPPTPLAIVQPIATPPPGPFSQMMPPQQGVHVQIVAAHPPVQLDNGCGDHSLIALPLGGRSPVLTS